jgi:Ni/Co efflux regulator RcnB
MRFAQRCLIQGAAAVVLAMVAFASAQAQSANPPGQGQAQGQGQGQEAAPGRQGRGPAGEPGHMQREGEQQAREARGQLRDTQGPRIDEREIRRLLVERRDWVEIDRSRDNLPPGIRMNLERGKPLPPGIAKQLDERILRDLPRYDGYEWRRVGPDVILVEAANAIIYEIMRDIFY